MGSTGYILTGAGLGSGAGRKMSGAKVRRAYDSFVEAAELASRSVSVSEAVNAYFSALYFLRRLAEAPPAELRAAGFSPDAGALFLEQAEDVGSRQDRVVNAAIKRAYEFAAGASDSLLQELASLRVLSPANREYLWELMKG